MGRKKIAGTVSLSIPKFVSLAVGVIFLVTGKLLPKTKTSPFVGVRTPWTLTSKRSWYQSQRLGGWLMVAAASSSSFRGCFSQRPTRACSSSASPS